METDLLFPDIWAGSRQDIGRCNRDYFNWNYLCLVVGQDQTSAMVFQGFKRRAFFTWSMLFDSPIDWRLSDYISYLLFHVPGRAILLTSLYTGTSQPDISGYGLCQSGWEAQRSDKDARYGFGRVLNFYLESAKTFGWRMDQL